MLVISKKEEEVKGGGRMLHVLNRWCDSKRVAVSRMDGGNNNDPVSERLLLEILADINQYLPDDWRMNSGSSDWRFRNRTDNEFRIELCIHRSPESVLRAALIGHSYRVDQHEILHIVDTVFHPQMFSPEAAAAITGEDGSISGGTIDQGVVDRNPELVVANMYYFSPCPDDASSPLFARQYERVRFDENLQQLATKQYHRIHPVTKAGLDPDHFRWIQWDTHGTVRFVPQPKTGYRGKTYWGMKMLSQDRGRQNQADVYKDQYASLLQNNGITPQEPVPPQSPYEIEFKFVLDNAQAPETFSVVKQKVAECIAEAYPQFQIEWDSEKLQTDTYLDDAHTSLLHANACFRLRKRSDHIRITLKKRFPHPVEDGLYRRIEEEAVVRAFQVEALKRGQPVQLLPYRLIAYVAPGCGPLREVVTVENKRTIATLRDNGRRRAELCFDELYFYRPGEQEKAGPFYEIELESKGMPDEALRSIATTIAGIPELTASQETKYERAVQLLEL